jgi:hypothetical protein
MGSAAKATAKKDSSFINAEAEPRKYNVHLIGK